MSSNRKNRQPEPAMPRNVRPITVMRDFVQDETRYITDTDDPERSRYVTERDAPAAVERGTARLMARLSGKRRDPAVLLHDLLEMDDNPYLAYADGMTRQNKALSDSGNLNAAVGRELRPGFVNFLVRRLRQNDEELAGHVVASIIEAMQSAGEQEQKWACATALRFCHLTHAEIARDMQVERSTVSKYLREAHAWMLEHLERQPWIQAYLHEAAARYHIDPYLTVEEMLAPVTERAG